MARMVATMTVGANSIEQRLRGVFGADYRSRQLDVLPMAVPYLHSQEKQDFDRSKIVKAGLIGAAPATIGLLAVVLFDRVNPIYRQDRVGYLCAPMEIAKIRTMPRETTDVSSNGHADERRSNIGRFLSQFRIDEFPQLLNIWRGEMSVIGPRALLPSDYENAVTLLGQHKAREWLLARTSALPGAFDEFTARFAANQIEGDAKQQLEQRVELELAYIFETASPQEDARIFEIGTSIVRQFIGSKQGLGNH
jgi:lipopolysaccharide/colanic/teichoic acid biosynthesis glycosyltransferase